MSSPQRRIFKDIFLAPGVVLPIAGGAAACLVGAAGGPALLNVAGLIAIVVGLVWMAARATFGLDKIVAAAAAQEQADALRQREDRLADIGKKLRYDRDPRTDELFTLLKKAREDFDALADETRTVVRSLELRPKAHRLFWAAIDRLEDSSEAHELAERLFGEERDAVLAQREVMLTEVRQTLEQLQRAVGQLREMSDNEGGLATLRDELDQSLRVAARVDQRMREIEGPRGHGDFLKE